MGKQKRRNLDATFKSKSGIGTAEWSENDCGALCRIFSTRQSAICMEKTSLRRTSKPIWSGHQQSEEEANEALTAPLYQQIGQLKVALDFLKKS